MPFSVNSVLLIGNCTKDPELKYTKNKTAVCAFSIATSSKTTKDGNESERSDFHNVVCFGYVAEGVASNVFKGTPVMAFGELRTESYEKDGVKRYITKLYAEHVGVRFKKEKSNDNTAAQSKQKGSVKVEEEEVEIPF